MVLFHLNSEESGTHDLFSTLRLCFQVLLGPLNVVATLCTSEVRTSVANKGAVEAILEIYRKYPTDHSLLQASLWALSGLSSRASDSEKAAIQEAALGNLKEGSGLTGARALATLASLCASTEGFRSSVCDNKALLDTAVAVGLTAGDPPIAQDALLHFLEALVGNQETAYALVEKALVPLLSALVDKATHAQATAAIALVSTLKEAPAVKELKPDIVVGLRRLSQPFGDLKESLDALIATL